MTYGKERVPQTGGFDRRPDAPPRRSRLKLIGGTLLGLLVLGFAWLWFGPCMLGGCAPVSELERYQSEGSELLDINGEAFAALATVNRKIVSIDSLPAYLPRAFLAVEDQRFYEHHGVDWRRVGGAFLSNLRAGGVAEGGSTISMQLARNLFPERLSYRDRTMRRKVMEIRIARQIERAFPKDKILELYLNHIYLGDGAYGVEAAAQNYFGKPAAELTIAEAAVLGGLPKAPSQINPRADRDAARERRDLVLRSMAEAGYVPEAEAQEAMDEPIKISGRKRVAGEQPSSYFVERVRRELEDQIGESFYTAGMKVYTTLDPVAQQAAEEELAKQLNQIEAGAFGAYRHPDYPAAKGETENGSTAYLQGMATVIDVASGEVRALVGGRDFEDSKFDRAAQALRQPGSAFKPFVYLTALERSHAPTERIDDAPLRLTLSGGRVWEPRNYTGRYDGPITMRDALTRSKNTVTVRLAQDVGMRAVIDNARDLGLEGDIPDVPATALGSAEVRPLQLISAYAAFANGGYRVEPHFVRRVEGRDGEVLWEAEPKREEVMEPSVAFVLTSMLRDVVDRGTGTAVRAAGFRGPAAGKTGTTNGATDVWFVGYTPELVGGVWIGLDRPATIVRGATGGTLAAPVWGRIMRRIYADRPMPAPWTPPAGVISETVDRATGQAVTAGCPVRGPTYTEYFVGIRPPTSASCLPAGDVLWASTDTGWVDEEYGASDLLYEPLPRADEVLVDQPSREQGIDWPELEQMRDRGDSVTAPLPTSQLPGVRVGGARDNAAQTRPATPRPQRRELPPASADTVISEPDPANELPDLLGSPARDRDRSAPPDTTGG